MNNIVVTTHDGWAHIRIDRAAKRNALNEATRLGLLEALHTLQGKAHALVLTGSERWFCCGADVKERAQRLAQGQEDAAGAQGIELAMAIKAYPGVVIAAVNGLALGYGVTLLNACDLALAADSAQLGLPELRSAAYASMSAATTQLSGVSRKQLAWMVFNTESIDAGTAMDWGLINEVVSPDLLDARAQALAIKIAGFDPAALAESKMALSRIPQSSLEWRAAMQSGQSVNDQIKQRIAQA
jgi:enoyl-CoA hydratase/carnithine racemase